MRNRRGLTDKGRSYLRALMRRGMLIGLEHMSEQSVDDAYDVFAEAPKDRGQPYPIVVSHAHFRRLSIQSRHQEVPESLLPSEYEVSDRQIEMVRRSAGVVGQFLTEPMVDYPRELAPPPFANDCAGSSKPVGYSLTYALQRMGGAGVGLASDFTVIDTTAPRFGRFACWNGREGFSPAMTGGSPQYGVPQDSGVVYRDRAAAAGVRVGDNVPLEAYVMGRRVYDFNVDGFAHYGLLPDLLQDLKNLRLPSTAFQALFSSAEAYLRTWEKAERAAQ
jgi:microsomal dipeptidase-like Zn-dependent dipeptidase